MSKSFYRLVDLAHEIDYSTLSRLFDDRGRYQVDIEDGRLSEAVTEGSVLVKEGNVFRARVATDSQRAFFVANSDGNAGDVISVTVHGICDGRVQASYVEMGDMLSVDGDLFVRNEQEERTYLEVPKTVVYALSDYGIEPIEPPEPPETEPPEPEPPEPPESSGESESEESESEESESEESEPSEVPVVLLPVLIVPDDFVRVFEYHYRKVHDDISRRIGNIYILPYQYEGVLLEEIPSELREVYAGMIMKRLFSRRKFYVDMPETTVSFIERSVVMFEEVMNGTIQLPMDRVAPYRDVPAVKTGQPVFTDEFFSRRRF